MTRTFAACSSLLALSLCLLAAPAPAQVDEDGPLAASRLFEKETARGGLVVFWSDNELGLNQTAFDYLPPDDQGLNAGLLRQATQNLELDFFFYERPLDLTAVDFDGDAFDEFVAIWERSNGDIRLVVPQDMGRGGAPDAAGLPSLNWTEAFEVDIQDLDIPGGSGKFPAQHSPSDFERLRITRVATGDLDGDGLPELVLGYWDANGAVQLLLFDTGGGKVPALIGSIADESLPPYAPVSNEVGDPPGTLSSKFDIAVGDFDGNGSDELLLVFAYGADADTWDLYGKAYGWNSVNGTLDALTDRRNLYSPTIAESHMQALAVATGDFDGNGSSEAVVGFNVDRSPIDADVRGDNFIQFLRVDLDLGFVTAFGRRILHTDADDFWHNVLENQFCVGLDLGPPRRCPTHTEGYPMTMVTGDVDGNGDDEALLLGYEHLKIYQEPSGPLENPTEILSEELPFSINHGGDTTLRRLLDIADLDPGDGDGSPEIVFIDEDISTGQRGFRVDVYGLEPKLGGGLELKILSESIHEPTDAFIPMTYAVAVGRFNGPDVSLGQPSRSSITDIVQPLVVLSAPPVHFDAFGDGIADLNLCYPISFGPPPNRSSCEFVSSYEKGTETSLSVTTDFHSDWAVSTTVEGELSVFGATVQGSLKGSFGEGFSRVESERQTDTITVEQRADIDDWIYAATVTYDIWEYPIYAGDDSEPVDHVAVVRPRLSGDNGLRLRWFNSKSYFAQSFLPPHEVGNILSYRELAAPDEASAFAEEVRFATSDTRTLSISGGGSWSLGSVDLSTSSTSRSLELGLEASLSAESKVEFPIRGFDPGSARIKTTLEGQYAETSVSTTDVSFSETVAINFAFTSLDPSIGDTNYDVTPYVYWAQNGALVLAYAAAPELAPPNNPDTWWQDRYGNAPDPTLILPWRLDPQKGIALSDDTKRSQTRDLRFEPSDPAPGENVTIQLRVQNFSLVPSPSVRVRFHLGDPDQPGSTYIGETTTGTIPPRENDIVSIDWTLPDEDLTQARIYALLDPLNEIANEIHEDNNKGWNALTTTVPEPGSAWLQLSALSSMLLLARRNRRRRTESP